MKKITVGGVPEHYNYPWKLTTRNEEFKDLFDEVVWKDYPSGTGAMCQDLRASELDVAIILTEGVTRDILNGNDSRILQVYVDSPLIWGVHTGSQNNFEKPYTLEGKKIAISRFNSGSHLMSYVYADQMGWTLTEDDFVVVNDLQGAVDSLQKGETHYFLWEKFTTKPRVDSGELKMIDECPTPWPCFVIVVKNEVYNKYKVEIDLMIKRVKEKAEKVYQDDDLISNVSKEFGLLQEDVILWHHNLRWNTENTPISMDELEKPIQFLRALNMIPDQGKEEMKKQLLGNEKLRI
ncbi:MAG: ABC transporter substrate-binding protein [Crocinitomicaceae bacterium]|nr:ABC transporter substrate-binding protein [Crocinitomicaceae bacterium]